MTRTFWLCSTLALAACNSAVEPAVDEVGITWISRSTNRSVAGERIDVDAALSSFQLDLVEPPPNAAMEMIEGLRFATGLVVLTRSDVGYFDPLAWRGFDATKMVVYLPEAPAPDSALSAWLSRPGPITAGYHIFDVHRKTDAEVQAWLACVGDIPLPTEPVPGPPIQVLKCGPDGASELRPSALDLASTIHIAITEDLSDAEVHALLPSL